MNITQEMYDHYAERTRKHIQLVQKYCKLIDIWEEARFNHGFVIITDPSFGGSGIPFAEVALQHDASKWQPPELYAYIWISWQYKMRDEGKKLDLPDYLKTSMSQATFHHIKNNPHHPEYWNDNVQFAPREGRDNPTKWTLSDASKMPDIYIAEMVADWMAMSEEMETSVKEWADKNVNIRWKFTEDQKNLIYELIQNIEVATCEQ